MNLSQRDKAVIWHPFTQAQTAKNPIAIFDLTECKMGE
jgi:hypothetical protein